MAIFIMEILRMGSKMEKEITNGLMDLLTKVNGFLEKLKERVSTDIMMGECTMGSGRIT